MPLPPSLKLAIVSTALSADPREATARARSAGVEGLQFDAYSPALSLPELSQSGRREFRHVLSSSGPQLASLRVDAGQKGFAPGADVERAIDHIDRAMEAAAGLSTPLVCVDLGPLPEPAVVAPPKPKIKPEEAGVIIIPTPGAPAAAEETESPRAADSAFESSVDGALGELGRRADRYSVVLAMRSDLASLAALDRALRAAACTWFGVDLDPVSILRDRWDAEEVFSRLGSLIRHVRGRDAVKGHDRRTQPAPIGRGHTNWEQVLALLSEAAYAGWIAIDPLELPDRLAAARLGVEHLRDL
jgi:sugar phosphate isomerase/epimerase